MPTPAERQALLFLAAVAVIGGGVRAAGTRTLARDVAQAERGPAPSADLATRALDAQIAAVDSARTLTIEGTGFIGFTTVNVGAGGASVPIVRALATAKGVAPRVMVSTFDVASAVNVPVTNCPLSELMVPPSVIVWLLLPVESAKSWNRYRVPTVRFDKVMVADVAPGVSIPRFESSTVPKFPETPELPAAKPQVPQVEAAATLMPFESVTFWPDRRLLNSTSTLPVSEAGTMVVVPVEPGTCERKTFSAEFAATVD